MGDASPSISANLPKSIVEKTVIPGKVGEFENAVSMESCEASSGDSEARLTSMAFQTMTEKNGALKGNLVAEPDFIVSVEESPDFTENKVVATAPSSGICCLTSRQTPITAMVFIPNSQSSTSGGLWADAITLKTRLAVEIHIEGRSGPPQRKPITRTIWTSNETHSADADIEMVVAVTEATLSSLGARKKLGASTHIDSVISIIPYVCGATLVAEAVALPRKTPLPALWIDSQLLKTLLQHDYKQFLKGRKSSEHIETDEFTSDPCPMPELLLLLRQDDELFFRVDIVTAIL